MSDKSGTRDDLETADEIDDYQFGFRKGVSTAMCTDVFKSTVDYYRRNGSRVFCCFIDFKKAFDRVDYWLLFCKLLDSNNILSYVVLLHGYWHFGTAINKFSFAGKIPIHSVLIWLEVSNREYCHHIYLNCM